jgi:hypothetical protein
MANTIDWGQGAVNNTIDWGKGKTNNTINWAEVYDNSPSGETNITGSGGVTPFTNTYSMSFDGIDEYFTAGNPSSLQITGNLTLSAWVKRDSTSTSSNYQIIGKDNVTTGIRAYALVRNTSTGKAQFNIWKSNVLYNVQSTTTINNDQWYHVMAVNDGSDLKIYVNGVLENTNVGGGGTIDNASTNFQIGSRQASSNEGYWNGNIDEVAVWDSDQSANINSIYSATGALDISSLSPLSWWRMGDNDTWNGSTWTLTDNGSGGNNATSVFMEEADRVTDIP